VRFLILKAQVRWWLKTKYIHFTREIKFCEQNCISHFTRVVKLRFTARVKLRATFFGESFARKTFVKCEIAFSRIFEDFYKKAQIVFHISHLASLAFGSRSSFAPRSETFA